MVVSGKWFRAYDLAEYTILLIRADFLDALWPNIFLSSRIYCADKHPWVVAIAVERFFRRDHAVCIWPCLACPEMRNKDVFVSSIRWWKHQW